MLPALTEQVFYTTLDVILVLLAALFIAYFTVRAFKWHLVDRWSALATLIVILLLAPLIGLPGPNGYVLPLPFSSYLITWTAFWIAFTIVYFLIRNKDPHELREARPEDWVPDEERNAERDRDAASAGDADAYADACAKSGDGRAETAVGNGGAVPDGSEDSFHLTGNNARPVDELVNEVKRKIPHLVSAATILCYLFAGKWLIQWSWVHFHSRTSWSSPGTIMVRQLAHGPTLEAGAVAAVLMFLGMFFFALPTEILRLTYPTQRHFLDRIILSSMRKRERGIFVAHFYYLLSLSFGVILLTYFSPNDRFSVFAPMALIMIVALGDSAAALVGRRFGSHHIHFNQRKTYEGLIGGFAASVGGALLFVGIPLALLGGAVFVLIDLATPKVPITDNILNPVGIAVAFLAAAALLNPMMPFY